MRVDCISFLMHFFVAVLCIFVSLNRLFPAERLLFKLYLFIRSVSHRSEFTTRYICMTPQRQAPIIEAYATDIPRFTMYTASSP